MAGVVLTAGYDRSLHALAIGELLKRRGIELSGVIVVSHFSVERIRAVIRQKGLSPLIAYALGRKRLGQAGASLAPLQEFFAAQHIDRTPMRRWARKAGVPVRLVSHINHVDAVRFVRQLKPDRVIYAGGGILRDAFIDAVDGRVLNAHSGPLPEIRGMNACEWTLLLGLCPAVTIHLVDHGIDTGTVLETIPLPLVQDDSIASLRERCIVVGISALVEWASRPLPERLTSRRLTPSSRQCFVLAPALRELLEQRLTQLLKPCVH